MAEIILPGGERWKRGISSDLVIIGMNRNLDVTAFSKKGERLTGFKRSEVLGKKAWETFLPREHLDEWKRYLDSYGEGEVSILTKEGKFVNIYSTFIRINENDVCVFGIEAGKKRSQQGKREEEKKIDQTGKKLEAETISKAVESILENRDFLESEWKRLGKTIDDLEKLVISLEKERRNLLREKAELERKKLETSKYLDKIMKSLNKKLKQKGKTRKANQNKEIKRKGYALDVQNIKSFPEIADMPALVVKKGIIQAVTPSFSELVEYDENELLNKKFFSLVPVDQLMRVGEYYLNRIRKRDVPNEYETVIMTKSKKPLQVKISASQINWRGEKAELMVIERLV